MKLIAETAWHHEGDFGFFNDLVTMISSKTDTDYLKFHILLDVDEYMYKDHPSYAATKKAIFSESQWETILNIALSHEKKIMLLFNDRKAIDFGMKFSPEIVEIHSVCLNDIKLLNHLKSAINQDTQVVLGIGGTELNEIEDAINILDTKNIVLMHGFQNYPTNYEDINFGKIRRLLNLFSNYQHGYADHTGWDNENNILITLFGAALGMDYIEKHVTTDFGQKRIDWNAAISIEMFNELSKKLNVLAEAYGNGLLKLNKGERAYSTFGAMKKAAILKKDIKLGDTLMQDDFDFKRTGQQSDLSQISIINSIGRNYTKNLSRGHCIIKNDLK